MEHVITRRLEHLTGTAETPHLGYVVEVRDRRGPAHKAGAYSGDTVWIQLKGGLFVAKATIQIGWIGEYSNIKEVRRRTAGTPIHDVDDFWAHRPKFGYAVVAELQGEHWIDAFWAGPRTYGYEWVVLDEPKKRASWLDRKSAPSGGADLSRAFTDFKLAR